jgi:hypothetical protein
MKTLLLLIITFLSCSAFASDCLNISDDEYFNALLDIDKEDGNRICSHGADCSWSNYQEKIRRKLNLSFDPTYVEVSILYYTWHLYEPMNRNLRNREVIPDKALSYLINGLSCALNSLVSYEGLVTRFVPNTTERRSFFEAHGKGKIVQYSAFTSTTKNDNFKGSKSQFFIHSKTGKSIEEFSFFRHEKEVLFNRNSCFAVIQNDLVEGNYKIEMTETTCPLKDSEDYKSVIKL